VLFFPEGTFTAATGLRPFRLGAFKAAMETGTPIVPVALQGSRHVLRADSFLPRPGRIRIWIGPEMRPEGEGFEALLDLRDRVAGVIATHAGEPRLNLVAAGPPAPDDRGRVATARDR
jgi:1-acyl-sn-glycerol-3-phosphate acyltransferase